MSTVSCSNSRRRIDSGLRRSFLKCLPQILSVANYSFRNQRHFEQEECVAAAVAWTWAFFVRVRRNGKIPSDFPTALAKFAVKHVRSGRRLGQASNSKDLYAACDALENDFSIVSLDELRPGTRALWKEVIVESRAFSPADTAAARIDINAWLQSLSRRDRRIAEKLASGERTGCVARMFQVTPARISQLRDQFRKSWLQFQREGDPVQDCDGRLPSDSTTSRQANERPPIRERHHSSRC